MPKFIFISGPPGSGKSTQARLISEALGFKYFDSGEMVRRHIKIGDMNSGERMSQGLLMPIKETLTLAKKELAEIISSGEKGVIISGIPRSPEQAFGIEGEEGIVSWLSSRYDKDSLLFIDLKLPEEESVKRNLHRHQGRPDDKKEVLKTRLKVFREKTLPVYEELKEKGYKVVEIDGSPPIEKVFESIEENIQ